MNSITTVMKVTFLCCKILGWAERETYVVLFGQNDFETHLSANGPFNTISIAIFSTIPRHANAKVFKGHEHYDNYFICTLR